MIVIRHRRVSAQDDDSGAPDLVQPSDWNDDHELVGDLAELRGPAGADGLPGAKGDAGEIGLQGPQGAKGDTGETGPQGPQGVKGDTGAPGADGASGGGLVATVAGNLFPEAGSSSVLAITNFDSASAYSVSATGGGVSLVGDSITYVAGFVLGAFGLTVSVNGVARVVPITIKAVVVPVPTVPGVVYEGGFYAGRIVSGGVLYALVVAPAAGGSAQRAAKLTNTATAGVLSLHDGFANSESMNNGDHPAAQWCRALAIGGHADWYMPSRDELEICYRNLKPETTANTVYSSRIGYGGGLASYNGVDAQGCGDNDNSSPLGAAYTSAVPSQAVAAAFRAGGDQAFYGAYYRASSETGSAGSKTWLQSFSTGEQYCDSKTSAAYWIRAVRRVPI